MSDAQQGERLTGLPRWHDLESIDHLGVEARRQLDAHACWEENQVKVEEVWLLKEPFLVLVGKPGDDGVRLARLGIGSRSNRHGAVPAVVAVPTVRVAEGEVTELCVSGGRGISAGRCVGGRGFLIKPVRTFLTCP